MNAFAELEAQFSAPMPPDMLGEPVATSIIMPDVAAPKPTPWAWRDPATIPPRQWTYGDHCQRQTVSVTAAPGAVGKTSLVTAELLCMATGRPFLGVRVPKPLKVWGLFLEEPRNELDRRFAAAMMYHNIGPDEVANRLFLDGNDNQLCLAHQGRDGIQIMEPVADKMIEYIKEREIDHLTVDPFVKSHRVGENDNSAIDAVATEWARIARECNISIELVHHTRKGNGQTLSSEDMRGASGLLNAARDGRILNKASIEQKQKIGVDTATDKATYFTVAQDKPNMTTGSGAVWYRTVGVPLGNGDWVATVEPYDAPDAFDGISPRDTLAVQNAVERQAENGKEGFIFENAQNAKWVGHTVAEALGLHASNDKARIKTLIETWLATGVLVKDSIAVRGPSDMKPVVNVGEWITDIPL